MPGPCTWQAHGGTQLAGAGAAVLTLIVVSVTVLHKEHAVGVIEAHACGVCGVTENRGKWKSGCECWLVGWHAKSSHVFVCMVQKAHPTKLACAALRAAACRAH